MPSGAHSTPPETYKMENFATIAASIHPLLMQTLNLDVCGGPGYVSFHSKYSAAQSCFSLFYP